MSRLRLRMLFMNPWRNRFLFVVLLWIVHFLYMREMSAVCPRKQYQAARDFVAGACGLSPMPMGSETVKWQGGDLTRFRKEVCPTWRINTGYERDEALLHFGLWSLDRVEHSDWLIMGGGERWILTIYAVTDLPLFCRISSFHVGTVSRADDDLGLGRGQPH